MNYKEWISDLKRKYSPEWDYGVHWTLKELGPKPTHPFYIKFRVSWIKDTGELYAVSLDEEHRHFFILGVFESKDDVERRMAGWTQAVWEDDSLKKFFPEINFAKTLEVKNV